MSAPLWSILIATVEERDEMCARLVERILRQREPYGERIEVQMAVDDGAMPVGQKRTMLLEGAAGDYVCFVDDDDQVAPRYVERIVAALEQRPDYVGFRVHYTVDGLEQKQVVHSLACGGWSETADAYFRDLSHLNPIRRELALQGLPFQDGFGEDTAWADRVRATGKVKREVFVDELLYHYDWRSAVSLFAGGRR